MFDIGFMELMVVAVLGLLVLGPERLPKAARTVGLLVGRIRRTMNNLQDDLERQVRTEELRKKLQDPYATFLDEDDERNKALPPKATVLPTADDAPAPQLTASEATATPAPVKPAVQATADAAPAPLKTEAATANQDQKPS